VVKQLDILGGSTILAEPPKPQPKAEQLAWSLGDDPNRGQLAMEAPAPRERRLERRVRLFQRSKGWRFAYEVSEPSGWRCVQEREPGTSWDLAEALKRARVYAELVGARIVRPRNAERI
jgi:hypothetical protein